MGRRSIGDRPMSAAERQQRRRDKAKELRDAATQLGNQHGATPSRDDVMNNPHAITVKANGSEAVPSDRESSRLPFSSGKPDDYPRMLYLPDGRTVTAAGPEQHEQLSTEGWVTAPLAVHRKRPVSHHGTLGAYHPFASPMRRW